MQFCKNLFSSNAHTFYIKTQEYLFGALWDMSDGKSGLLLNSTHPSLPVARNLITLDWIASDPSFNKEHSQKIVGCEGSSLNG